MTATASPVQIMRLQFTHTFLTIPPYNFELTVHKPASWEWLTPFEVWEEGMIWSGFRLDSGNPVGIRAWAAGTSCNGRPRVTVAAYSSSQLSQSERAEAIRTLGRCLGVQDDVREFYRMGSTNPILQRAIKDLWGMRETPPADLFSAMIMAVTLQLAPMTRTKQMTDLLYRHFGTVIQLDGHRVIIAPTPLRIARLSESALRETCKLGFRVRTLKECAKAIIQGTIPNLHVLATLRYEDARKMLRTVHGLGEYAVAVIGAHPSFPADSWSWKIFSQVFHLRVKGHSDPTKRVKAFAARAFGRWQSYVYAYVLNDLSNLRKEFNLHI